MNIFIELPTWLGDTIMTTPAINSLIKKYPDAKLTFFGSKISLEALKVHPNCIKTIHDESKTAYSRIYWLYNNIKTLKSFDMAVSFRSSFMSKILLYFLNADKKMQYNKKLYTGHQVQKYAKFLNIEPKELKLYHKPFDFSSKTVGLNPGATYGNAKRWYPKEFAKTANELSRKYGFKIIIFGGPNEVDIAKEIEKNLDTKNYINLAGKTTVDELIQKVAGVDLFITNDSGPMHIAAAYKVPTIALFGPTNHKETSQWNNPNGYIISKYLDCAPCMKRECPLKHHKCMKDITAEDVVSTIKAHRLFDK
jgi:heptosyltransferase-2